MVSNYIKTPKDILQLHKTVSVVADIIFVNSMEFLVRISRNAKFTAVQYLGKRMTGNISKSSENINDVYYIYGMYVDEFYTDREFENIRRKMPGISTPNTTAADENVPEVEEKIRVIKERSRTTWSTISLNKTPGRTVIEMTLFVVLWMSYLSSVGGTSQK